MPTLALFSDIHANLPALEAVLEDIARRDVDGLLAGFDALGVIAPTAKTLPRKAHDAPVPAAPLTT